MSFDGNEEHEISFDDAAQLTYNYRKQMDDKQIQGGFFGRKAIETLLAQDSSVGIRYYYGLDDDGYQELVLVGTDGDENDLVASTNIVFTEVFKCPPTCGENNMLNS